MTNPVARGMDTDYTRLQDFTNAIEKLSFAYYFSDDTKYSDKGIELLKVWFLDPATRVNPNLNYSQGVPGLADGRPAGILEWARIAKMITATQIFQTGGVLPIEVTKGMQDWFERYLDWVLGSRLGREANALPQNHATWYNYQVVGLMIFLGRPEAAKAKIEETKRTRIAAQINVDGRQPMETGRSKSLHYSSMNLWALANLTFMGRKLGIDLWDFETPDGRSIPQAYAYLKPFALGTQEWPFRQITPGGARETIEIELKPLFSKTASLLKLEALTEGIEGSTNLLPLEALQYPPRSRLKKAVG